MTYLDFEGQMAKVKVTAGRRVCEGIHVEAGASKFIFWFTLGKLRHKILIIGHILPTPSNGLKAALTMQELCSPDLGTDPHSAVIICVKFFCSPLQSEGVCFYGRWFVCVSVCLSVTKKTKNSVDGLVPNFVKGS